MILAVWDVRGRKLDKNVSKTMQALKPNSYLSRIFGWKEEVESVRQRVFWIEKILKELERFWFIDHFKRDDEEGDNPIHWHIWKRKNWFFEPKLIEQAN